MSGALRCSFPTVVPSSRSSRCPSPRSRSGTRVGVARQPPGDHDPSFSRPIPSFRLDPVEEPAEEVDHLARSHHPMSASSFFAPSLALLGPGAIHRLGPIMKASGVKKALIITDTISRRHHLPIVETVRRELFSVGVDLAQFDEVSQNPTTEQVNAALQMAEEVSADCLVSVGGDSTHDAAKAVRALFGNTQQSLVEELEGVDELAENPLLQHFAVSTTSGSSSELTRLAIITDSLRHEKVSIVDQRITPTVACDDTLLMHSQPPELIAASGFHALAHAVEAYLSTASTPVTDAAALHAIRLISTHLRRAVQSPPDQDEFVKAQEMLTYAEFLAGLAFNSAGLGLTHAMSNQTCALYPSVPLAECTSVILPHVLHFYGEANVDGDDKQNVADLFVDLAAALGCRPAAAAAAAATAVPAVVRAVAQLAADIELPQTLRELDAKRRAGMKKDDIPEIALKVVTDPGGVTSPRKFKLGEVESLFFRAWDSGPTGYKRVQSSEYVDFNDTAAMIEPE